MAHIGYGYGSEWHLLHELGRRRETFTRAVEKATQLAGIEWLDHVERTDPKTGDRTLVERVGLDFLDESDPARVKWEAAWPQSGGVHNWDAVGRASSGARTSWVLLEAKGNTAEVTSSCTAKSTQSLASIRKVLDDAKRQLGVPAAADWMKDFYQYCNRIALLNFLVNCDVDAHLIFVYFTGDRADLGRAGRDCPVDESGWCDSLAIQDRHVALPVDSPIRIRVHRLFVPVHRANIAEQILRPEYCRAEVNR